MTSKFFSLLTVALITAALLLIGCDTAPPDRDMTGPALSNVSLIGNPNPAVPLAAILSLTTDDPAELTLDINDGERSWSVTPSEEMTTQHEVPVLGMRPGRVHTITASLRDTDGNETLSEELTFETPSLPDAFPTPRVTVHNPDAMEPGVTVFNINGRWDPTVARHRLISRRPLS